MNKSYVRVKWSQNDPNDPRDMLGQPIAEGDYVSWPISIGRSVGMSVGEIVRINFKHKNPDYPFKSSASEYVNGAQQGALHYTLSLRPLITTGHYHEQTEYIPQGFVDEHGRTRHFKPTGKGVRPVTLRHVGKVLRLHAANVEDALAEAARSEEHA